MGSPQHEHDKTSNYDPSAENSLIVKNIQILYAEMLHARDSK